MLNCCMLCAAGLEAGLADGDAHLQPNRGRESEGGSFSHDGRGMRPIDAGGDPTKAARAVGRGARAVAGTTLKGRSGAIKKSDNPRAPLGLIVMRWAREGGKNAIIRLKTDHISSISRGTRESYQRN